MRVCIKCNPASVLMQRVDGSEFCVLHGDQFVAETQPDAELPIVEFAQAIVDYPAPDPIPEPTAE